MSVPPSLVLFDVDDTLCDYAGARHHRLRIALGDVLAGRVADLDAVVAESIAMHPHGTDHFAELLARYGATDGAAIESARAWYRANRFLGLSLFPDALDALRLARAAARRVGLVTNGPAEVQRAKIELLGLEEHVDFVLVSGEFGVAKPDPAIFAEALRLGGASPAETLFVGDSPEFDIAGARAARIRAVWMNRAGQPWAGPEPPPDHEARTLADLAPLLGIDPNTV